MTDADARVVVFPAAPGSRLPDDVRADVEARIAWLRDVLLPELDRELGVPYPPVQVAMTAWVCPTMHERAYVFAVVSVERHGDRDRWVARVSAAALRMLTDDALRGLFAHEFLHVVHFVGVCLAAWRAGREPTQVLSDLWAGLADYWTDVGYRRGERATLADPADWLPVSLRDLSAQHGHTEDPGTAIDRQHWRLPWPADGPREIPLGTIPVWPAPLFSLASLDPQIVAKLDARALARAGGS